MLRGRRGGLLDVGRAVLLPRAVCEPPDFSSVFRAVADLEVVADAVDVVVVACFVSLLGAACV